MNTRSFVALFVLLLTLDVAATPAPVSCDPPDPIGLGFDVYFAHEQFLNHTLYWPCTDECSEDVGFPAQNQLDWIVQGLVVYWAAQNYLVALAPDPNGNYCLYSAPFGSTYLFWPSPIPPGGCGGHTKVYIPTGIYAQIVAAFDYMDCVQEFTRTLLE